MDRFDHDKLNNEDEHEVAKKPSKEIRKRKPFASSFLGGILGGILSALLVIGVFFNGSVNESATNNETNQPPTSEATPVTTVNTNEETNIKIDEISQAIVGVINVQQQNVWTQSEDAGVGSGIIYKKENGKAYIVTNNHVVKGAEEVEVKINQDDRVKAKVLGTDELSDLAVLEIDADQIDHVAKLGLSADLHVGETVYAIGNPLSLDFSGSVTKGIISGLERSVKVDTTGQNGNPDWEMQVIQTDAAINPGNSGGALVNSQGQVIGINSMKIARAAVEGIGFAIPIDTALPIIEQLEKDGEVTRPVIGIAAVSLHEVPAEYRHNVILPDGVDSGVVIANVQEDSPADEAGLQQFDVVTKINDAEIKSMLDLRKYLYTETDVGDSVKLEAYRDGKKMDITLELAK